MFENLKQDMQASKLAFIKASQDMAATAVNAIEAIVRSGSYDCDKVFDDPDWRTDYPDLTGFNADVAVVVGVVLDGNGEVSVNVYLWNDDECGDYLEETRTYSVRAFSDEDTLRIAEFLLSRI